MIKNGWQYVNWWKESSKETATTYKPTSNSTTLCTATQRTFTKIKSFKSTVVLPGRQKMDSIQWRWLVENWENVQVNLLCFLYHINHLFRHFGLHRNTLTFKDNIILSLWSVSKIHLQCFSKISNYFLFCSLFII